MPHETRDLALLGLAAIAVSALLMLLCLVRLAGWLSG